MKTYKLTYKSEIIGADDPANLKELVDQFISTLYDVEDDGWRVASISTFNANPDVASAHKYYAYVLYEIVPPLETLEHYEETIEARIKMAKEKESATGIECPKCKDGQELEFVDETVMLSSPLQREIICPNCGFETTIFVP